MMAEKGRSTDAALAGKRVVWDFLLDELGCAEEDGGQGYLAYNEEYAVKEAFCPEDFA